MTSWRISYRWRERDESGAGDPPRAPVRHRTVGTVDLRPYPPGGARARQLADVSRYLRRATILRARRDQPRERAATAPGLDLSGSGPPSLREHPAGVRRRDVPHRSAERRGRAGHQDRTTGVGVSAHSARGSARLLRRCQPRRRSARGSDLRRDDRCAPRRARHADRPRSVGRRGRRLQDGPFVDCRSAVGERQSDCRDGWSGVRGPRVSGRVRYRDRQARLAPVDRAGAGRARPRHLERRQLEARRRDDVGHGRVRPRDKLDVLGNWQSRARFHRRRSRGRQPVLRFADRRGRRHRRAALAFSVHPARRERYRRHGNPHPRRRRLPRPTA